MPRVGPTWLLALLVLLTSTLAVASERPRYRISRGQEERVRQLLKPVPGVQVRPLGYTLDGLEIRTQSLYFRFRGTDHVVGLELFPEPSGNVAAFAPGFWGRWDLPPELRGPPERLHQEIASRVAANADEDWWRPYRLGAVMPRLHQGASGRVYLHREPVKWLQLGFEYFWKWPQVRLGLLYFLLVGLVPFGLRDVGRWLPRRQVWMLAGVTVLALFLRAQYESLPSNWQVDYIAPFYAENMGYIRRDVGFASFFAWVDFFFPIQSNVIFLVQRLASSLFLFFLGAALLASKQLEEGAVWLLCVVLATDFSLVYLGASDAPHNVGVMCLALGTWFLGRRDPSGGPPPRASLSMGAVSILLAGLVRPELALAGLAVPCLLFAFRRDDAPRPTISAAVAGSIALATMAFWVFSDIRATQRVPDTAGFFAWAWEVNPLGGVQPNLAGIGFGVCGWLAAAALGGRRFLLLLAGYLLLVVPRLGTGFLRNPIGDSFSSLRYDAFLLPYFYVVTVVGYSALGTRIVRFSPRWSGVARGLLFCLPLVLFFWPRLNSGTWLPAQNFAFRQEFALLRDHIGQIEAGSKVIAVWVDNFDEFGPDLDVGLAPGHSLLLFERPDVTWFYANAERGVAENADYLYKSAVLSIDTARFEDYADYFDDFEATPTGMHGKLASTRAMFDLLEAQTETWIYKETLPAKTFYMPLRDGKINVGLAKLQGPPSETSADRTPTPTGHRGEDAPGDSSGRRRSLQPGTR